MDDVTNLLTPDQMLTQEMPAAPPNQFLLPNEQVPPELQTENGQMPMQIQAGAQPVSLAPQPVPVPQPAKVNPADYSKPVVAPTTAPTVPQVPAEAKAALATYDTQQRANSAIANAAAQKS